MGAFGGTGKIAEKIFFEARKFSKYDSGAIEEIHDALLNYSQKKEGKIKDIIQALTQLKEVSGTDEVYPIQILMGLFATKSHILHYIHNPLIDRGYYILTNEEYEKECGLLFYVKAQIEQQELQNSFLKHIERMNKCDG